MAERKPLDYSGIFYDSADLVLFKKWFDSHILGGATTNPLILQREKIFNIPEHVSKMIEICGPGFPISIEIPDSEMSEEDMIQLGQRYHERFPDNAVIKVPMDPRDPQKAFEVAFQLGQRCVRVNATLGLSMGQLVGAAEALRVSRAQGDNYISLFWARRDEEAAKNRVPGAAVTLAMTLKYLETHSLATRVIVGSIRSVDQIEEAFSIGADIVTIPPKLIVEWMFTQRGIETADQFNQAYRDIKDQVILI